MDKSSKTQIILLIFAIVAFNSIAFSQTTNEIKELKIKLAGEAGDRFVKRFRETLDFGIVFDEMASKKAREKVENGELGYGEVDKEFFAKQDPKLKERTFKLEMNVYYLWASSQLTFASIVKTAKKGIYVPASYVKLGKTFKSLVRRFVADSNKFDDDRIDNEKDLAIYLKELQVFAKFMRKSLPRKFYDKKAYKKVLSGLSFEPRVSFHSGDSNDPHSYYVVRDIFQMVFIEEHEKMKILALTIGN
jgi:hypothetical protein